MNSLLLLKALADESRLHIVMQLRHRPFCVEDLAEVLKLAVSTVSAHLKKLQEAGVVYSTKQQYYSVYHLKKEILNMKLDELIPQKTNSVEDKIESLRHKVIQSSIKNGRITHLPSQNKKRWIVYQEIIKLFECGRSYSEKEINELIQSMHEDYCLIRRELVDEGVLSRTDGVYQMVPDYHENPGFYQKAWLMSIGDLAKEK